MLVLGIILGSILGARDGIRVGAALFVGIPVNGVGAMVPEGLLDDDTEGDSESPGMKAESTEFVPS